VSKPPGGWENKSVTVVTAGAERLAEGVEAPSGDDEARRLAVR